MKKLVYMLACALAVLLLAVPVFAQEGETLDLKYDDRKSLAELLEVDAVTTVAISNEVVSSCQVGTETPDAHVLHYEESSGTLYAVGVGTATLTVDGTEYAVTVEPAVISLIMYTGHSVGHGACGDATQSVVVEAGQAYSIYDPRYVDFTQVEGYGLGWGSENRVSNKYQYVTSKGNNHIDAFAPGQNGTRGAGAALAWQWNNLTGEKLWVLNTAVGGSCLNEWMPNASWHSGDYSDYYNTAVKMYTYAQSIIKNEIAAGHYELGHMGLLYYCGANDKYYPAWNQEKIEANYETLWNSFSEDLSLDVDGDGVEEGPEYMGLVPYWIPSLRSKLNFDKGSAQFMASSAEYPHLFIASNMLREFMWDENLGNFPAINYTTQSVTVTMPTSVSEVEGESCIMAGDDSHPTQVAYNAIGIDTANNLYAQLNEADNTIEKLTLIDEGFNELTDGLTIKVGEPCPVAPWFEPFTADNLSYSVSGNAELIYPLQLVGTAPGTATLAVSQNGQTIKTLTVNVVAGHGTHCVCGGTLTGAAAQKHGSCDSATQWIPLDTKWQRYHEYTTKSGTNGFAKVLTAGNYYLESDFTWSGLIYVAPGETVNICLNGHKLATTGRSFEVHGTLNICDCKGGGQVYSPLTGEAPVAYVRRGGTWNIYGGSYSAVAPKNRDYGGIACVSNEVLFCDHDDSSAGGYINLYGGTLYGSQLKSSDATAAAGGSGGCIMVRSAESKFCMYGGTLSGGSSLYRVSGITSTVYPGGIIGSAGTVELWGGTICNSTDPVAAVYGWGGTVTLKGSVNFENNANADIYVRNDKDARVLKVEAPQLGTVVVSAYSPGSTLRVIEASYELCGGFTAPTGYKAWWQDGKVYVAAEASVADQHIHCVCGGKAVGVGDHKCMNVIYAEWTDSTKLPTSGTYYLSKAITTSTRCDMSKASLQLCLNGQTVTNSYKAFKLTEATVDMCDCNESEGSIISSSTGTSALISTTITNVTAGSSFNLYSGKLIHTGTVADVADVHYDNGTVGYRIDEAPIQIGGYAPTNAQCIMRMYGGTVQGGTSRDSGAAIQVQASSSTMGGRFYMYGGTVIGGKAVNDSKSIHGGALSLRHKDSQAFIHGGTITGGEAGGCGGNIFVEGGKLWLYGGTITGGKAGMNGGNLYVNGADAYVYLKGNTVFEAADAGSSGSNIYVAKGTVEMENGTVKGTDSFCVASGDLLEISGGTFTDGLSVEGATVKSVLAASRILVKTENNAVVLLEEDATTSGTESVTVIGKPQVSGDLKFSAASVTLYSDLGVNFKVGNALLTEGGFTAPYVVFAFSGQTITEETYIVDASGRAVFRFRDIAPHMIGDTITATLYATRDGVLYMGEPVDYSVKQYCYNMLGTYNDVDYPSAAYGELRTLLVDLLNYCSAAQQYVTYNTDSLANAKLLDKQKAWGTQEDREPVSVLDLKYATVENPSVTWVSGGLRLEDSVTVRYTLATESLEGLTVKVQAAGKEYVIDSSELVSTGTAGQYYLYFDRLNAAQMSEEILVTAYKGDAAVSNTVRYSIESYVAADDGDEAKLTELVKAMLRYGDAAKAYVN